MKTQFTNGGAGGDSSGWREMREFHGGHMSGAGEVLNVMIERPSKCTSGDKDCQLSCCCGGQVVMLEHPATGITWETLKAGDYITSEHTGKRMVQAVLGTLIFYSDYKDYYSVGTFQTSTHLQRVGWSIVQPETKKTITKEEAEKQLGVIIKD